MDKSLPHLAAPARRALSQIGVTNLEDLTRFHESDIQVLHGMGPSAMRLLREALESNSLSFNSKITQQKDIQRNGHTQK